MTAKGQAHEAHISWIKPAPSEVDAGSDITLMLQIECALKCTLEGQIKIEDAAGVVIKELALVSSEEQTNGTDEFVVKAPIWPGKYSWSASATCKNEEGILHVASPVSFSFTVKPHATSLAVWDIPSPVVIGSPFKIKVGVQCSAGCKLAGQCVAVVTQEGLQMGTATLGEGPWADTNTLYWAEADVAAPGSEGVFEWTVKFAQPNLEMAHAEGSYPFAFTAAKPPDHVVTVQVVDKEEKTPVPNALVMLYPYRGTTDERGVAKIGVSRGEYELRVPKMDKWKSYWTNIKVEQDLDVKAELSLAPIDPS